MSYKVRMFMASKGFPWSNVGTRTTAVGLQQLQWHRMSFGRDVHILFHILSSGPTHTQHTLLSLHQSVWWRNAIIYKLVWNSFCRWTLQTWYWRGPCSLCLTAL